jgi:spore maturation protein CgeB
VANDLMVEGSGLEELCLIFKDSKDLLSKLEKMFTLDFDRSMIEQRATFFASSYSNSQTCKTLVENIYTDDTSYK